VRKTAGATAANRGKQDATKNADDDTHDGGKNPPDKSVKITSSILHSAIEDLLQNFNPVLSADCSKLSGPATIVGNMPMSAAFSNFAPQIGILGNSASAGGSGVDDSSILHPGAVVLGPTYDHQATVKIASPSDDTDVANLRLSVFSEFSSPNMQNQFHVRSCQALQSRRLRGAICLVARVPRKMESLADWGKDEKGPLLGSAECSFHEFFGTRLGRRRPYNSILYVTEVAVATTARRQGIGRKLLEAMDKVALARGAETLYLHVDVANKGAIELYEKAGYKEASLDELIYAEFTTSLNLHPGAHKGRDHALLYKDLKPDPTWLDEVDGSAPTSAQNSLVGALGFEIPA